MNRSSSTEDTAIGIEDVVKVDILGEGTQGIVWSARKKGRSRSGKTVAAAPYALKWRLIKKTDAAMHDTKTSSVLRELEFYLKVANKHPEFFSKLYDWSIIEATQEIKDSFNTELGDTVRANRSSQKQYTHLFVTLSARKEGVLKSVYHSLSREQWLSMLAQLCHAIALIHEKGFSHGDVWEANVSFMRVPWSRTLQLGRGVMVPSCGYVWSIIDYGSAELHTDETEKERKKKRASSYELDDLISLASGEDDAEEVCESRTRDLESKEFKKRVFSSIDGPSVREVIKNTGLPVRQALALMNLDAYLWHVCKHERSPKIKPWIDRESLIKMADARASYSSLATFFARMARNSVAKHPHHRKK